MLNSKLKTFGLWPLFLLAFSLQPLAFAADVTRISALLTITNAPTTAGQTLVVNSSTRTWTNNPAANPSIYIQTNSTIGGSITNLFQHLAQYRFVNSLNATYSGTNALKLQAAVNQPLTVTAGGGWATVAYSTQLVSTPFTVPVRVPLSVEVSSNAVSIAELLLSGLNDYSTSRAFTNWTLVNPTIIGPIALRNYIVLASPFSVDGSGAVFQTTNSSPYFGQALFSGTAATNANYAEYRITVPEDLDTSADLKVERLKFRLNGADTNAVTFNIGMASVADSASYDSPTLGQWIALSFAGDASGASGDVETISNTTLTGWRTNLTAGRLWVIRLNRNGAGDPSTVGTYSGPLVLSYGLTQ